MFEEVISDNNLTHASKLRYLRGGRTPKLTNKKSMNVVSYVTKANWIHFRWRFDPYFKVVMSMDAGAQYFEQCNMHFILIVEFSFDDYVPVSRNCGTHERAAGQNIEKYNRNVIL